MKRFDSHNGSSFMDHGSNSQHYFSNDNSNSIGEMPNKSIENIGSFSQVSQQLIFIF